jgi:protein-S-isoprenylcysteine O-methyltransferase Ste14
MITMVLQKIAAFWKKTTKEKAKDTGMAMVLLLLLFGVIFNTTFLFKVAIGAVLIAMVVPSLFRPIALLWFGGAELLSLIVSRILLTLVFFLIVTPIGMIRRLIGKDDLLLKKFKVSTSSAMVERTCTFTSIDMVKPY